MYAGLREQHDETITAMYKLITNRNTIIITTATNKLNITPTISHAIRFVK